jgi:hypothetical protein
MYLITENFRADLLKELFTAIGATNVTLRWFHLA